MKELGTPVWKQFSTDDVAAVVALCELKIPPDSAGLRFPAPIVRKTIPWNGRLQGPWRES